jgi:small-conductance mechanosensitive channel
LLYTTFKRVNSARSVQIPNNVLNSLWVENVSRSKAMREQLSIFVDFGTTFEDIQLLRNEMSKFVTDKDNVRDFQPNVEIEVVGIGKMESLELRVEIQHKSNWANESVRASRRSRFMCALVLALRKVPIYGPSGSGPALGEVRLFFFLSFIWCTNNHK